MQRDHGLCLNTRRNPIITRQVQTRTRRFQQNGRLSQMPLTEVYNCNSIWPWCVLLILAGQMTLKFNGTGSMQSAIEPLEYVHGLIPT